MTDTTRRGNGKRLVVAGLMGTALAFGSAWALASAGEHSHEGAQITKEQARDIALKAYPGKVTDAELESEKGGSGLRYSFDIQHNGVTHEVGVDARTGRVLENSAEGPNPD
ncbi:MAG: peptidase M4 [Chromatiales bacterium 21-64-14]|nr:MAG: peptidase M4 [Chromatiales bacterium 21-64-14]HQU15927.1 PepSY domain-containing protein [Gammaproteobacteria bacterium]